MALGRWLGLGLGFGLGFGVANPNPNPNPNPDPNPDLSPNPDPNPNPNPDPNPNLGRCCLRCGGGSKTLWVAKACSSSESLVEGEGGGGERELVYRGRRIISAHRGHSSVGYMRDMASRNRVARAQDTHNYLESIRPSIARLISLPISLFTRLRRKAGTGFSLKWISTLRHRVGSARSSAAERDLEMCSSWWARSAL